MLVVARGVELRAPELQYHVARLQHGARAAVRQHARQPDAGLAGRESEPLAQRRVGEVLPRNSRAREAAPVSLRGTRQELREHRRRDGRVRVAGAARHEPGHAAVRDHDLGFPEALGARRDVDRQQARLRQSVAPRAHLAQRPGVRVEQARALPAQHLDGALAPGARLEWKRREALPEGGVVDGHERERALVVHELHARHRARVAAELLRFDQQRVAEGGRGDQDPVARDDEAGDRPRPGRLLLPRRARVPVLAGDAHAHDPGAQGGVAGGRGGGGRRRGRRRCHGRGRLRARRGAGHRQERQDERVTAGGRAGSHTASGSPGGRRRPSRDRAPRYLRRLRARSCGSGQCSWRTPGTRRRASGSRDR